MFFWEKEKTETYGIPAGAAAEFENQVTAAGVHLHGFMFLQGRKILAEKYYEPYGQNSLHRMYSITKSFVALAVGLLEREGKIKLQDRICDYFPEYTENAEIYPWCKEMTIEDMLSMRTCYGFTTYKIYDSEDWTKSFFRVEPDHIPGTVFSYDTSSSHTLAALVEKLTGKKMLDYLRENCLAELGFSEEAYIIPDGVGVSQGGSGMMSTLRDVACAAYLCNHYGWLDGRELLPEAYIRKATSNLVPTDLQPVQDEQCGYGYFFWMPREEGFCMYGMGGQLALCFPKKDFCLLTMADTIGNQAGLQILYDCFYHFVYPYLKDRPLDNPRAFTEACGAAEPATGAQVPGSGSQIQGAGRYRFYPNAMNLSAIVYSGRGVEPQCGREEMELRLYRGTEEYFFSFYMGAWKEGVFPHSGMRCRCRGDWKQGHLILQIYLVDEEQGHLILDVAFRDKRLGVRVGSTNEPYFKGLRGFASAWLETGRICSPDAPGDRDF